MLSNTIKSALNEQFNAEMYSSYLYLMLSYDFRAKSLAGFSYWFKCQAREEMGHAQKIADRLLAEKADVVFGGIKIPSIHWKEPVDGVQVAVEHEKVISERIRSVMSLARKESDFGTENLMAWFVREQIEEERSVYDIYTKLKSYNPNGCGILFLDSDLAKRKMAKYEQYEY